MVEIVLRMERIMIIVEKRGINGSQLYSAQVYANFWARLYMMQVITSQVMFCFHQRIKMLLVSLKINWVGR